ncbi:MAG: VWA domain-containing protein, partial [Clostridiales bacterium]
MRKVISVILVVVMLINFVTLNGCSKDLKIPMEISADVPGYVLTVGDKTKVKINGTYLNGESDELKDVKLSSSNKDIFEIKDDKIIAKKEGNATLIAKKDDDKIEVPVSVFENEIAEDFQISKEKLIQKTFEEKYKKVALEGIDKPTISSFMAGNDVKIIWSYPDTEKEFILYRSEKDKNKYKQIYEGKAGKNSNEYVDNEVSNKKSYSYKVKVKDSKGKTKESNITSVDVKKVKLFKAGADDDEDGILNEEELKYGLNPFKKDSDGDKKSDKEELKELKNLIKQDKPLKTIEKSTKEVDEGFEKNFKTNNNDVALSVVGDKKIKDSDLSVKELETDDLSTVKGLKGNLYDIELSEEEFKEAEITLSYDENDIGNTKPEDLKVYWLDRDGEKLVALENTKVDEEKKTVTGTTKHFSEYILGDGKILGQQVNEVIGKIDIVFVMDNSIRMQDKDQYGSSKKIIEKYLEIINEINKNEENMRIGLVTYTDKAVEVSPIVSDFNKLTTSLNSIKYIEGNSNIISGLEVAETMLSKSTDRRKVMVLISDGKDTSENTNNDIKAVLDDIKDTMTLNTISIGEDIEQEFLQELAKKTNGLYYKVDAKGADEESDITKTAEKMLKQFVVEKIAKATLEDKAALEDKLKLNYPDRFIGMDNLETQMLYSPDNANLLTGNFTEQKTDFTIKSSGQDLEFTRTYNSELNNESSILGNGWTTNLDTKVRVFDKNFGRVIASVLNVRETAGIGIENTILTKVTYNTKFEYILDENGERIIEDVEDDKYQWAKIRILNSGIEGYVADKYIREGADSAVELIYESGTRILFNKKTLDDGTLKFVPQADFTDKLEFVNNEYVVTKNGLSKIIYDENGRLKALADRYGNRVNVEYTDEKVSKISDVNGRFIEFSYNDNGNLKSATDMLGRVATYSYDDYNNLTRVTDLEEVPTTYTYYTSEENRLKEIYVDTKQERKNEYDIFGRLTAQYKNGIVSYHVYKDAIKDPNDYTKFLEGYEKSMSYYIDEYGRTTEVEYSNLTFKPISAKDIDGHIAKFNYYYDYNRGAEVEDESTRWTSIDNLSDDEDINTYVTEKETDNIPLKKDITDKNDEVYENKYDGNGNLVEHKQPLPSDDAGESYSNSRLNKYDKYGNLIERKTKEGYLTKYIYSDDGVYLEKEIDPLGNEKVYEYYKDGEYSTNGLVKSVTDNKMNKDNNIQNKFKVTKYTYDNTYNNKKQTVDGLDENVTIEEYDGAGRLTKKTNPNELVEEYQYDRMDRGTITKKTVADANGGQQVMTERIFYDNFGNKVRELNPKEYIRYEANKNDVTIGTRYEYDESDRLIKIIDGLGNTTQYKYDLAGNKTQEINAKNAVTKYEYDDFGRVKAVTDALGHTLTKNYDKHGNLIEIVDPLNIKTTYEYDKLNRKVKEKIETTTYNNIWEQSYKYDADNRITQVKDAGGKVVKTGYDGLNRKVTEIDGYGVNGTLYKEDNTGEYVSSTDESIESKIEYIYDAGTFKDNNNQDENFEVTTVRLAGDSSVETETYYDVIGQLRKDEDFEGNAIWNSYDIVNNTMTEIDPKENVSLYEYDQVGRLNKLSQDPTIDDSGNITGYINTNTYVYDLNNNMIEHRDPSQILTTVVYDKLDRQCVISMGNHLTTNIPDDFDEETLDDQRNEASLGSQPGGNFTERGNKILYVYDEVSNVVSEYAWDVSEDLNLSEDNSRKTSYKYDLLNRNTKVTDPEGNWFEMGYNWKSDIEYQTSSNNEEIDSGVTYFYDELYRVVGTAQSSKKLEDGDTLDSITQQKEDNYKALYPDYETTYKRSYIEFEYDIKGNLVKQIDPNGNLTTTTYDARDRVTNQVVAGDDTIAAYTTTYGYDKLDNLVVQSDNVPKYMTMYYDKMGRVLKQGIQEEGKADSFIGEKFTYDPNGNPKTHIDGNGNETTFAYDAMDRLVKNTKLVSDVEQNTIYKYFENGNLKSEINWKGYETKYYYNNLNQHTKTTDANLIDIEKIQYFEDKKINILKFDAEGKRYDQEFDKTGRIVYESDPGKNGGDTKKEAIYEYDDSIYGQIITQKMSTEDSINVTKSSMDLMGRLASVETYETDLNGKNPENNVVTKYEYDSNGNAISQENGEKNTTLFEYNAANQVKKRILPGGRSGEEGDYTYVDSLTEKYTYRPDGSINSVLDKNNTITKYSYDIYGRVEEKSGTKAPVNDVEQTSNIISFTYDNNSNIKSMTDGTGTTKWDKYDELNRPTTKNVPDVGEFTYQYDIFPGIGQRDEDTDVQQGWYSEITTDPQGNKTKRIFDKTDRLRGIKAVEGEESFIKAPITKYNYYNDGALRDVEYPNSVGRMDFQFYDNNLVSKVTNGKTGESYEYKYDKVNNLSEKVDKKG